MRTYNSGQGLIEYAGLVALVTIFALAGLSVAGTGVLDATDKIANGDNQISSIMGGATTNDPSTNPENYSEEYTSETEYTSSFVQNDPIGNGIKEWDADSADYTGYITTRYDDIPAQETYYFYTDGSYTLFELATNEQFFYPATYPVDPETNCSIGEEAFGNPPCIYYATP